MSESALLRQVKKYLNSLGPGVWYLKTHGGLYQRPGIPDLLICANGRFVAIELKAPGRKPTTAKSRTEVLQARNLEQINRAGGLAFMIDSLAELQLILAKIAS